MLCRALRQSVLRRSCVVPDAVTVATGDSAPRTFFISTGSRVPGETVGELHCHNILDACFAGFGRGPREAASRFPRFRSVRKR